MIENLNKKRYRLETITIEKVSANYFLTKNYVRQIEIHYLGKENKADVVQILTRDYSFSNEDNSEGKLIKQISYLFDEVELSIDIEGTMLKVLNKEKLQTRWKQIQIKLMEFHKGSVIENYFQQITELLKNEQELISFLEGYNMFGLLFNGLWSRNNQIKTKLTKEGYTQMMIPEIVDGKLRQKIIMRDTNNVQIDDFKGINFYTQNTLEESYIEIQENNHHFKYSLLWIG